MAPPTPASLDGEGPLHQPAASSKGGDAAEEQQPEPRQVLLHTEPVVHERTFLHGLALAFGAQYDPVTGLAATNEIHTSRYTILTFLPVNLFNQFTRVANLYFLVMAVRAARALRINRRGQGGPGAGSYPVPGGSGGAGAWRSRPTLLRTAPRAATPGCDEFER